MHHNNFQDPEFTTQVVNQLDSERKACGHPHEILIEGCRVIADMPRIALDNIRLLYAYHQLEFQQEGDELRVRVKGPHSLNDSHLEEYIPYLATTALLGATCALSCEEFCLRGILPF